MKSAKNKNDKSMNSEEMLEEYDFSNAVKNPYTKDLKKQISINISTNVIDYFKKESEATGIPYQTLINLYLSECVSKKMKLTWATPETVNK